MGFSLLRASSPLFLLVIVFLVHARVGASAAVMEMRRKLGHSGGGSGHLADLRNHDARRHLSGIDIPLGGNPVSQRTGLYFTEIFVGTPEQKYKVQLDTSTGAFFLNCYTCRSCPIQNGLGMQLKLYDPRASSTSSTVFCGDTFCVAANSVVPRGCTLTSPCQYNTTTGDGRSTEGFFVKDLVQYNQVSGDGQTIPVNTSMVFGCGANLAQDLESPDQALDGIVGFGQSNSSMLSQLAASGKVKNKFAHCLDTENGGGIFVIGNVKPRVNTTGLVPNMTHYTLKLKSIDVAATTAWPNMDTFVGEDTIIDMGTTLTYLPENLYKATMIAVFNSQPDTIFYNFNHFLCFQNSGGRVDEMFPKITFNFEGLALEVYPHEYLLSNGSDRYCLGIRNGASLPQNIRDMVIMGDLVLSNRLVVYDLETQVIGWTEFDCSSSIKIEDEVTGAFYDVKAHRISSKAAIECRFCLLVLLVFLSACCLVVGW